MFTSASMPFPPGTAVSTVPQGCLGKRLQTVDVDWSASTTGAQVPSSDMDVIWQLLRNDTTVLTKATLGKYDFSGGDAMKACGAVCGAGGRADFCIDPYLGTTGVPANYFFWGIVEGPGKATASTSASIAAGDALMSAAAGKVLKDPSGLSGITIGRAIAANSTAAALFRVLFNFTGGGGVATSPALYSATFSIGVEASNAITVAVQLVDKAGVDLTYKADVLVYFSTDTGGDTIAADMGSVAAGTDGTLIAEPLDDIVQIYRSEADGDIDLVCTSTGTSTFYANVQMPDGSVVTSAAITFA